MALLLTGSVGSGGDNAPADVRLVQMALREIAHAYGDDRANPGPADGRSGDGTEGAIEHFQRLVNITADGRVDVGGFTARALWRWLDIADAVHNGSCWIFPIDRSPSEPYHGPGSGMRAFGWRRSGGKRRHAGVDLYAPVGTPVRAVADGVVKRAAPFYLKTDAVEVEHGTREWAVFRELVARA